MKKFIISLGVIVLCFMLALPVETSANTESEIEIVDTQDPNFQVDEETKKTLPELEVGGVGGLGELPDSTYENRKIHRDVLPSNEFGQSYIPINFKVDGKNYPAGEIFLSELNNALNIKDPNVDTFLGIYNPETQMVSNYFPVNPPSTLTLLLNSKSYFAEDLTLDVEEWWQKVRSGQSLNGTPANIGTDKTIGVSDTMARAVTMTHGGGVDLSWSQGGKLDTPIGEMNWEFGITFNYNFSHSQENSFSRTYHSNITESIVWNFGNLFNGDPYIWGVYDLVTQTSVNYSKAKNLKELDGVLRSVRNFGLIPEMSSHSVRINNSVFSAVEIPIHAIDQNLAKPTALTANPDFQNLTVELNWDAVPVDEMANPAATGPTENNGKVAGYYLYKNDVIVAKIHDPNTTQWVDTKVRPEKNNKYYLKSFSLNSSTSTVQKNIELSTLSNIVYAKVELNSANFKEMVIGCSLPFAWEDDQLPAGERTYYNIYLGYPSSNNKLGSFEGKDASININPELYDLLKAKKGESFYIEKEVIYNGQQITSRPVPLPSNFTVTETAFLFDKPNFWGDCTAVNNDQDVVLSNPGYEFDNKVSSMLMQGNIWVYLYRDSHFKGFTQGVFPDGELTYIRDFDKELIIGSDTVSSIKVNTPKDGLYLFDGKDYSGRAKRVDAEEFTRISGGHEFPGRLSYQAGDAYFGAEDNWITSVKVIGDYAAAMYTERNFKGSTHLVKADYGNGNLNEVRNNNVSSFLLMKGKGVWLFDSTYWRGSAKRLDPSELWSNGVEDGVYTCLLTNDCGFANDSLSSVLVIGDYGIALYDDPFKDLMNSGPNVEIVTNFDKVLGDGTIGNNTMSSFRVFPKGVYLGKRKNFSVGAEASNPVIRYPGEWRYIEEINIPDDAINSVFVVGDYRVTLYSDTIFRGKSLTTTDYVTDLGSESIGGNSASSLKIETY
ncbi:hypothetical protein VQL36_04190 [Chengkuizengella sp. SCS-71B]|uniref:hypothetical protein n=1 Tax=Chengkuizengella sp. SCS-71B TaxID=3115290 RepID=UPI0032C216C7